MAKTIKEMSLEYAKKRKTMLGELCNFDETRGNYETGANAVLECLERAIELNESTFVYSREKYIKVQVLNELIEKIRVK